MSAINKNVDDLNALSVLIICTEEKQVIFIDVEAFTVIKKYE